MKSELPKGLHEVLGVPMVDLVGRAMRGAGIERPILVIGHGGESMQARLGDAYEFAWQREQKGTGHAVLMAAELLKNFKGTVVIAPGDTPLLGEDVIRQLIVRHEETRAKCTVASSMVEDPTGYGRIVRDHDGIVRGIVEHKDCTPEQREINEVNAAVYCFDSETMLALLPELGCDNAQGEYYLTDLVSMLYQQDRSVVGLVVNDTDLLRGVNDRVQLSQAENLLRQRVNQRHMLAGVSILDPEATYIGLDVRIGPDTVIEPNTYLVGETVIGANCEIGPNCKIKRSKIGDGCFVYMSHLNEAVLEDGVKVGPFANIRPGAVLRTQSKVGNFVEIKNAELGQGSAANHLTYIGDAIVGAKSNIGAGTITCNYDGLSKHRTTIGSDVFIGSNSTLVAPVTIEDGSMVAAGSVVTHNVPADSIAFGRARQEIKEGWVQSWRNKRQSKSE